MTPTLPQRPERILPILSLTERPPCPATDHRNDTSATRNPAQQTVPCRGLATTGGIEAALISPNFARLLAFTYDADTW